MNEQQSLAGAQGPLDARVRRLAEAHWGYVAGVLAAHGEDATVIAKCGHHYVEAFAHGWKHAKEDEPQQVHQMEEWRNYSRELKPYQQGQRPLTQDEKDGIGV